MNKCKHHDCERNSKTRGYCDMHYRRLLHHGDSSILKKEMHGKRNTPEYTIWDAMIQRCTNKNSGMYHRYGGRGIIVCDTWRNSFTAFLSDMGEKPFINAQIDRIDNDGNYEKSNCVWTSNKENNRHTCRTKLSYKKVADIERLYSNGDTSYRKLAKIYNCDPSTIRAVIQGRTWK